MSEPLRYDYGAQTILALRQLQEAGHLNLTPGFQRKSVWGRADRRKFIHSILDGYPVPSIFLYKRDENGKPVYDVIDGKQRLETIFLYCGAKGFKRHGFDVRFQFSVDDKPYLYAWRDLQRCGLTEPFLSYRLQTVEVSGDISDIVDLFVRINSTGKALTGSERRHARFYENPLLKQADRMARQWRGYLTKQRIFTPMQLDRMRDTELACELLVSIATGGPINKKLAVDRAVGSDGVDGRTLKAAVTDLRAALRAVRKILPELASTRFRNSPEFYSLVLAVWQMQQRRLVLGDRKRNRSAAKLLTAFSVGVDRVQEQRKAGKGPGRDERVFEEYLSTVLQSTDAIHQRKRRGEILTSLLEGLFERKDDRRLFSATQRRILWHSDDAKRCASCAQPLDWTNFQVDHRLAHSRGGPTSLRNADLICRSCNSRKGSRRSTRRRSAPRRGRARAQRRSVRRRRA